MQRVVVDGVQSEEVRIRVTAKLIRLDVYVHSRYLYVPRSRTVKFSRLFAHACA